MPSLLAPSRGERPGIGPEDGGEPLARMIHYAAIAPSSHNTQPWRFRIGDAEIDLFADPERRLPVVDPDGREMRLSLGAALENLMLAAEHFGYRPSVAYFPDPLAPDWVARVSLREEPRPYPPPLFAAIPHRHTNRRPYRDEPVDEGLLATLRAAAWDSGIWTWTSADPLVRHRVAELVARGDRIEFADPTFRRELGEWIGRGLLGLPWTLARLAKVAVTHTDLGKRMARMDATLLEGSGALLVLVSKRDDPVTQLRAGQALERVWLLGTQLGLALHPMSQPLQIPELRRELAGLIGAGENHPQFLFRIGYAEPDTRRPLRIPPEEVMAP